MKLTDEQQAKLVESINEHWPTPQECVLCHHTEWALSDTIFELRDFDYGNFTIGGTPIFPVIPMSCTTCGNSILLNAIIYGLIDQNKDTKGDKGA